MNTLSDKTSPPQQQLDQPSSAVSNGVLSAVRNASQDSPIIVDFDETLFLRNSTQAYLGSIYPRPLGLFFLLTAKATKPWRALPAPFNRSDISRDWLLVLGATLLFPWTLLVWRYKAKTLAQKYYNLPLAQAIDDNDRAPIVIATLGFGFIVNPLVRYLPMSLTQSSRVQVIACRFWLGILDRAAGKLKMVRNVLSEQSVSNAVVVTDSNTDQALLDVAATSHLITWPDALFVPAMSDLYVPLLYSEKIKNPGKAHFIKRVVLGHWAFGVIAWSYLSPHPILNSVSLFLLTLSYWCVYEIGYQENDTIGEKYEQRPTLSQAYREKQHSINLQTLWPWVYGIAFAIPGCVLFAVSQSALPLETAIAQIYSPSDAAILSSSLSNCAWWLVYLFVVRLSFWLYNRLNELTRIWVFPLLQAQRMFGFSILASTSIVGTVLLAAFLISRWVQYCVYRCGGERTAFPINVSCLLLFTLLYVSLAISSLEIAELITGQAAIAFAYCALRAVKKVRKIGPQLGLVTRR